MSRQTSGDDKKDMELSIETLAALRREVEKKHFETFMWCYGPKMIEELAARGIDNLPRVAKLSETEITADFPHCMQMIMRLMKQRLLRMIATYRERHGLHILSTIAASQQQRSLNGVSRKKHREIGMRKK